MLSVNSMWIHNYFNTPDSDHYCKFPAIFVSYAFCDPVFMHSVTTYGPDSSGYCIIWPLSKILCNELSFQLTVRGVRFILFPGKFGQLPAIRFNPTSYGDSKSFNVAGFFLTLPERDTPITSGTQYVFSHATSSA